LLDQYVTTECDHRVRCTVSILYQTKMVEHHRSLATSLSFGAMTSSMIAAVFASCVLDRWT